MILIRLSDRRHGLISWAFGTPSDGYSSSSRPESMLVPRKGGGGHGAGGESSSGSGGSSGKSSSSSGGSSGKSSSSGSSSTSSKSSSISVKGLSGGKTSATTYGPGGGKTSTISEGQPFAGRTVGGGTRAEVYGSSKYGSGYPPSYSGKITQRGLPYYFWPIVWSSRPTDPPKISEGEGTYGKPDNTSRPGGALVQAVFFSNVSESAQFTLLSDNFTVTVIMPLIKYNCSMINNSTSSSTPVPYNPDASSCSISNASSCYPVAEQAIQYYRASTVVLTLDGYNNTAVFASNETDSNATSSGNATPLPSLSDTDQSLLGCLNGTIGAAVPLVDGGVSSMKFSSNVGGLVASVWLVKCLIRWIF
ncbi:uncharacterized protein STEHIDRAFT_154955 [Stereum hirsutum FP-91666 SS1]|uniref:uncharacterized protein n=1 Tax=Stereum hirsutum (strain FP-91666) TaxID=721885 RepID=UPI000440C79D|nr:uncharacterized protein STEHIDRAFT_154955 [Stereum hirsutum FP-91666 SS1]EIM89277.1 hypothetical protein STEHIDRAFT_154955 [Stereum hirsutum FP-91666 SS1]